MKPDDMIDILNELLETSKDGQFSFADAAAHSTSVDIHDIFVARASDCALAVSELKALVSQCGGKPDGADDAMGVAACLGLAVCSHQLNGCTDLALLEECERHEDTAEACYRKALDRKLPEPIRSFVERQYQSVQRNHEQMRRLRDRFRAALAT